MVLPMRLAPGSARYRESIQTHSVKLFGGSIGPAEQFHGMGLYRLRGTVRYPAQATPVRSSLSRVRENRKHGLKGVC